jgi:hypothetical protein
MKITLLSILFLFFITASSRGQTGNYGTRDFKKIQQEFYHGYPGFGQDTLEGGSFLQFKRWEMYWGPRSMPHYNLDSTVYHHAKFTKQLKRTHKDDHQNNSNWQELGPMENGIGGIGRIDAITFHPMDSSTIYAGSPSGGAWVSYDRGQNWQNLNTDLQLPAMGISSIAIDPEFPDNIFLGTGDIDSKLVYSIGIYRSTDAGQTWHPAGLNNIPIPFIIGKVLLHPTNNDLALASTSIGIYKTSNRNAPTPAWNKVYPAEPGQYEYIRNMDFNPNNPDILYATGIDVISSHQNGDVNSWFRIATAQNGLDFANTPYPNAFNGEEYVENLNMTLSPQGDYLYINCVNRDGPPPYNWQSPCFYHVFSYDIVNDQWNTIPMTGLMGSKGGPGITAGRTDMVVSPEDSKYLYSGGVRLYRFNTEKPEHPWSRQYIDCHVDVHELVFSPWEPNVLYAGTDGGIYKRNMTDTPYFHRTADSTKNQSPNEPHIIHANNHPTIELNTGLGTSTIWNFGSSSLDPYQIMVGYQDCGINYLKNNSWSSPISSSDGFQCLMDNTDTCLMYATTYRPSNGSLRRSAESCLSPGNWDIIIKQDATYIQEQSWFGASLIADPTNSKTLIQARLNLWKVDDASTATIADWYKITDVNQLTASWGNRNCVSYALEIAPSEPDYIYFSAVKINSWVTQFDANKIFKTTAGGGTNPDAWADITPPTPGNTEGTYFVSDIAVSSTNPENIWISYSGYLPNYKIKFFDGIRWTNYNEGLPNIPINCIIYANGSNDGLFIGTDFGVYYRDANMAQWEPFMNKLPAVRVTWLELNYTNQKLRAGTYGRGLWETDIPDWDIKTSSEKQHPEKFDVLKLFPEENIQAFLIFPNPNTGSFTLSFPPGIEQADITMFDAFGLRVLNATVHKSNPKISTDQNLRGIFLMKIKTAHGSVSRKVVVE